jgi:hypothetical protein
LASLLPDTQKMLDLKAIVQQLGVKGRGKYFTSQEQLSEVVSGLDDRRIELPKLPARPEKDIRCGGRSPLYIGIYHLFLDARIRSRFSDITTQGFCQKAGETVAQPRIALADRFNAWDDFDQYAEKTGGRGPMKEPTKAKPKGRKAPEGDKRQFLTTMDPELIKAIKLVAIDQDTSASVILETAAKEWIQRRGVKGRA